MLRGNADIAHSHDSWRAIRLWYFSKSMTPVKHLKKNNCILLLHREYFLFYMRLPWKYDDELSVWYNAMDNSVVVILGWYVCVMNTKTHSSVGITFSSVNFLSLVCSMSYDHKFDRVAIQGPFNHNKFHHNISYIY